MYLYNTQFKGKTSLFKALSKIAGIGDKMGIQACDQLGVSKEVKLENLSPFQIHILNQIIHQNYLVESSLRALIKKNKMRLSFISSYRGFRHIEGLPCHGQRTHTNARTSRKEKVALTANKGTSKKGIRSSRF